MKPFNLFNISHCAFARFSTVFLICILNYTSIIGQNVEICNNGIDDDFDGIVDEFDPDCIVNDGLCDGSKGDNIFPIGDFGTVGPADQLSDANPLIYIKELPQDITTYNYGLGGYNGKFPNDGNYVLANSTAGMNPGFFFSNTTGREEDKWITIEDNSPDPNGYMMVVNADFNRGVFYKETVSNLCGGKIYEFSVDIVNIYSPVFAPFGLDQGENHILPNIEFILAPVGTQLFELQNYPAVFNTGDITNSGEWNTYGFSFTVPEGEEELTLAIRNNAPGGIGNDLAIDNISFRVCGEPVVIELEDELTNTCGGEAPQFNATQLGGFATPFMQWQLSEDGGISWENIAGANDIGYEPPALVPNTQYRLTVADTEANLAKPSCRVASNPLFIDLPPLEFLTVVPIDTSVCINDAVQIVASGGVNYSWTVGGDVFAADPANNSIEITLEESTIVLVTAENADGCVDTDTVSITVVEQPVVEAGPNESICAGEAITLQAEGASLAWDPSPTLGTLVGPNPVASPLETTTYYVNSGLGACSSVDSVTIEVLEKPELVANPNFLICEGDSVQLDVQGAVNYSWSPDLTLTDATIGNPLAFPIVTTSYEVVGANLRGCTDTAFINVEVFSLSSIEITPDTSICEGDSILLSANGADSYVWSPDSSLNESNVPAVIAKPDTITNYIVNATTNSGCEVVLTVEVDVLPFPVAYAGEDSLICTGESLQLEASGGVEYSWILGDNISDPLISNPVIQPEQEGYYVVEVANRVGCSDIDSLFISLNPSPDLTVTPDTIVCENDQIQLNAAGAEEFFWFSEGLQITNTGPNPFVQVTQDDLWVVIGTNEFGCEEQDSVFISVIPKPVETIFYPEEICVGDIATIENSGSYQSRWSTGETANQISFQPFVAGPREFWMYPISPEGCSGDSVFFDIEGIAAPNIEIAVEADSAVCPGESLELTASGGISYVWTKGDNILEPQSNSTIVTPQVDGYYKVEVENELGCSNTDSIFISLHPIPEINATQDTSICEGEEFQLTASGGEEYVWTDLASLESFFEKDPIITIDTNVTFSVEVINEFGCLAEDFVSLDAIPLPQEDIPNEYEVCLGDVATISLSGEYNYLWRTREEGSIYTYLPVDTTWDDLWVIPSTLEGCVGDTIPFRVRALLNPIASFTVDSTEGFGPLEVQFTNTSQYASEYIWDFQTGTDSSQESPLFTFLLPGQYEVLLTAKNRIGCLDTASFRFIEVLSPNIYFPNAFSPNGDGRNDTYAIPNSGFNQIKWQIFNRWGKLLVESFDKDYRWDGKVNGVSAPEGVYVCRIDATTETGIAVTRTISVTLIR